MVSDLMVGEAQHAESLAFQPQRSAFIRIHGQVVRRSVDLDHQSGREADEIDDEASERLLPSEAKATDTLAAELTPQQALGLGLVLAEGSDTRVNHPIDTLPAATAPSPCPLPQGEGES
jgi:hypothetical protein